MKRYLLMMKPIEGKTWLCCTYDCKKEAKKQKAYITKELGGFEAKLIIINQPLMKKEADPWVIVKYFNMYTFETRIAVRINKLNYFIFDNGVIRKFNNSDYIQILSAEYLEAEEAWEWATKGGKIARNNYIHHYCQ